MMRSLRFFGLLLLALLSARAALAQSAFHLKSAAVAPLKSAHGKITVLIFVRTDCPISNRYAPLLLHLHESYSGRANFWLVYPDKKTSAAEISDHAKQFHYTIPILRDPQHSL